MHSCAFKTMCLEVETDEKMLKARTIDVAFWRYKFLKFEHLRTFWNQGRCMVHSDAIWNDVLEIGNAERILKARTQHGAIWRYLKQFLGSWYCWENCESKEKNGAFWRYLKRCCGSWNCLEHFESKEAKWCILILFEMLFCKLELLRKCWN